MYWNPLRIHIEKLAVLALAALVAGCSVKVDKGANGEDKNVQVDTPFGGVHVNTDQTTAADLGMPVYPGAEVVSDDDNHKSADVHLGLPPGGSCECAPFPMQPPTRRRRWLAFYKKALGRYGDVITCLATM